jgi:hypothetical protein
MDGPVVTIARRALEDTDVDLVLPYVPAEGEGEVRDAFRKTLESRVLGAAARDVADRWFYETVVRVHRAGEGAAFTGLKPAGLDVGPVIPVAERALATDQPDELIDVLCTEVREQVERRFEHAMELRAHAEEGVAAARDYVEAMLGLQVWSHTVHKQLIAPPHAHGDGHAHN